MTAKKTGKKLNVQKGHLYLFLAIGLALLLGVSIFGREQLQNIPGISSSAANRDRTSSFIYDQKEIDVSASGVTITYKTARPAISWIQYYESENPSVNVYTQPSSTLPTLDHSTTLSNLKPGTKYNYNVHAKDDQNVGYSFSNRHFWFRTRTK